MVVRRNLIGLVVFLLVCAVILFFAVILIALYFRKIRKKIDACLSQGPKDVDKSTVKRAAVDRYIPSCRRSNEPTFYESPPLKDGEQKDLIKLKVLQQQNEKSGDEGLSVSPTRMALFEHLKGPAKEPAKRTSGSDSPYIDILSDEFQETEQSGIVTYQDSTASVTPRRVMQHRASPSHAAKTMPRNSRNSSDDSYIECIRDDAALTTFQGGNASVTTGRQNVTQQSKSLLRIPVSDDSYIECVRDDEPFNAAHHKVTQQQVSRNPKSGDSYVTTGRQNVTQPQVSRNHHAQSTISTFEAPVTRPNYNSQAPVEFYEVMSDAPATEEFYENSGFTNEPEQEVYGNQEIIESHGNTRSPSRGYTNYNQTDMINHVDSHGGGKGAENNFAHTEAFYMNAGEGREAMGEENVELYENFIAEDMYENC